MNTEETGIADGLCKIAKTLRLLGNADAETPFGAMEAHGMSIIEASEKISNSLGEVAHSLRDIAEAIRDSKG